MYRLRLGLTGTLGTSGRTVLSRATSLNSTVKIISEKDLSSSPHQLGTGRFGTCYLSTLSNYQVCVKVFKCSNNSALCNEANVLSKFVHQNLPYLFGVCLSKPAIVTSSHGFDDCSVILHHALFFYSIQRNAGTFRYIRLAPCAPANLDRSMSNAHWIQSSSQRSERG